MKKRLGKKICAAFFLAGICGPIFCNSGVSSAQSQKPENKKASEEYKVRAIAGANIMKKIVPVPEQLKINKAMITSRGDVCYEFRFPNASGGISIQKAVLPVKGDSLLIPLSDGFKKAWNSKCAGKTGEDVVDYLQLAIR